VQLYMQGNQFKYPILNLNGNDKMDVHFDDLEGGFKNYQYTYILCNADWTKTNYNNFDYIKGFTYGRFTTYRNSSIAKIKYTHYSANLPENNCKPSKSGNYILIVYKDNDTAKKIFTKRFLVVENKIAVGATFNQPFSLSQTNTHQKMLVNVNYTNVPITDPLQQVNVTILPNYSWAEARTNIKPTFLRQNSFEISNENDIVFEAGNEWRYLDLRSFRFQSDRIAAIDNNQSPAIVKVKNETDRNAIKFLNYIDLNGAFSIEVTELINPLWQSDFATVKFNYSTSSNKMLSKGDVYLYGAFTQFNISDENKMAYNETTGSYEISKILKQGFYNYRYAIVNEVNGKKQISFAQTEGNYGLTENDYTILVYYKNFFSRHDELIGITTVNSFTNGLFRDPNPIRFNPLVR
jgi:hypothetical protein